MGDDPKLIDQLLYHAPKLFKQKLELSGRAEGELLAKVRTYDMGGTASTGEMARAVAERII